VAYPGNGGLTRADADAGLSEELGGLVARFQLP
jgi:hypothetical protein